MKNTLLLTAVSLLMRGVGLGFQAWLAARVGAAGIGLICLVGSVGSVAGTLALAGTRFTAVRLLSEELGHGRRDGARRAAGRCLCCAGLCGLLAGALLLALAEPAAAILLRDSRGAPALRILALSLPFSGMGAVFSGCFTALGRVGRASAARLSEQVIRIAVTAAALGLVDPTDPGGACTAVAVGSGVGDVWSFLLLWLLWRAERQRLRGGGTGGGLWRRLVSVAAPLAASASLRSVLSAGENLLIPRGLRLYGAREGGALAQYGTVSGMALPAVTFPAALLYSVAELTVPALTEDQAAGRQARIAKKSNRLLEATLLYALGAAGLFCLCGDALGQLLFRSGEAGRYIRCLGPLLPLMYLDTVTDGILRGLGQQLWSMLVNIGDAVLRVAAVLLLLPRLGIWGYLLLLYASELLNFSLSMGRLVRCTAVRLPLRAMTSGLIALTASALLCLLLPDAVLRPAAYPALYLAILILLGEIPAGACLRRRNVIHYR